MTAGTDALKTAWRDYQTEGVPSSGPREPQKWEIRAAFDRLSLDLAAAAASAGGAGIAAIVAAVQPVADAAAASAVKSQTSADSAASYADSIAETNAIVGAPVPIARGHAIINGTFNTGGTNTTRAWTLLVPESGYLQAVNVYVGKTGTLTASVLDPTGKVVYSLDLVAGSTGPVRFPLPKQLFIAAFSRVVLTENAGKITYQNSGSDVVLAVAGPHAVGETPTQTTVVATSSFNYEAVILPSVPVAQAATISQADFDALRLSIRPISMRTNSAGNVIVTYLDGTTQNLGAINTDRIPLGSLIYAADDPAPGFGSPMLFSRLPDNGGLVVTAANGANVPAYRKSHAANPAVLTFGDLVFMYFRVDPGTNVQSIALWTQPIAGFDPLNLSRWTDRGVVVGVPTGAAYDGTWDPSAIVFKGKVRLYWQSHTGTGNLFTAESADGITFSAAVNTGVQQAGAPTVTAVGDTAYAFYGSTGANPQGLVVRTSADGVAFSAPSAAPVIASAGNAYAADGAQIVTSRFFYQAPYLYMLYGGTPQGRGGSSPLDWPEGICLARAVAPFTAWEKHPSNPVFLRGPIGAFDAAALWSGSYLRIGGVSYMFYEAMGGSDVGSRDNSYQGFGSTAFSQIGVARAPVDAVLSDWSPDVNDLPPGVYTIQNVHSGKFLGVSSADQSAIVCQYSAPQRWIVQRGSDGFYILSLKSAGAIGAQLLTNPNASRTPGANPNVYPSSSAYPTPPVTPQEFKLVPQLALAAGEGVYGIVNRWNGLDMEPVSPTRAEAAQIAFSLPNGHTRQKWRFTKVADA
jgi:hypothetical protein